MDGYIAVKSNAISMEAALGLDHNKNCCNLLDRGDVIHTSDAFKI